MKKVLVVAAGAPFPLIDGSAIRVYQDLKFLKRMGFVVDFVYVTKKDDEKIVREGLKSICRNVYRFPISKSKAYWNVIIGLLTNHLPMQVNYFHNSKMMDLVNKHHAEYDLLFSINIRPAENIRNLKNKKAIDYVDSVALNYGKARHYKNNIWRLLYDIDYRLLPKYENDLLRDFDVKFTISDADRKSILGSSNDDLGIVRNYYGPTNDRAIVQSENNHNIVFVGSMFYDPNVVASVYFVKNVLPLILQKYPDACFYIVGNRPTKEVMNLSSEHVVVTGFVEDVWTYLKDAGVVVVPMQSGAGLQNKILEALSVRACIVTSTTGAGGLVDDEGKPFVAKDAEEMAKMIIEIFEMSLREKQEIVERGYEYLMKYYSEDVVFDSFKKQFDGLVI